MSKKCNVNWLNHDISIELPDPKESNTIYVLICRQEGTYDPKQYNAYLAEYQFSAKSDDPNDWVLEGIRQAIAQACAASAIATLASYGHRFHVPPPEPVASGADYGDLDGIPF